MAMNFVVYSQSYLSPNEYDKITAQESQPKPGNSNYKNWQPSPTYFGEDSYLQELPIQYRRGIPLIDGYQSYDEYYQNKNLFEEKKRLFPLESTGVWTELNPKVPRVDYMGLHFVNKDTGWAVGVLGTIIKTTDGGNSWKTITSNTTTLLLKVHSYNGEIVIVTGYDGTILRSIDGGINFTQVISGVGNGRDLWGAKMLNDSVGWVCGTNQTLLKTTDAGQSWQMVTAGLNQHYWSLDFLNEEFGMIACGGGIVLKTTNGGNTWIQTQAGDTRALYTIDIIDSLHVAAAGGSYGKNVYSSDGGTTWIQNPDLIYENGVNCIVFINADTGYAIGENWAIRKTENRGQIWWASAPVYADWWLNLLPNGIGYAAGNALRLYKTSNGYDSWKKLFFTDNINDVHFINEDKGFIVVRDPAKLYKTTNSGISWDSVPGAPGGVDLLFLDSLTGFIAEDKIYKTTNGGDNWYQTNSLGLGAGKIFFVTNQPGWATSGRSILKTTDGGENWFVQITHPSDSYTSIFFVDSLNGWATSRYIWQTTNGGTNWIQRTDIPALFSDEIYFIDTVGFIIEFLKLYKTTNSGNNWFAQLNSQYIIRSFGWLNKQHGFIVGDGVYETTDSGNIWDEILELRNIGLRKFYAPQNYIGYSIGYSGLIYKYLDTMIVPVELSSFNAEVQNNYIILKWSTATETNNYGFEIYKSNDLTNWKKIGFIEGKGTSTSISKYKFMYNVEISGKYYYKLKQIDFDGSYNFSNHIEANIAVPTNFKLSQNFPNPFNSVTKIIFEVPIQSNVKIILYDILGNEIIVLINESFDAGYHSLNVNASGLSSGIYFYRMTTDKGYSAIKKLIMLK